MLLEFLDDQRKWVPYQCHKYRPVIFIIGNSPNAPRYEAHDDRRETDQIRNDVCSGHGFRLAVMDMCQLISGLLGWNAVVYGPIDHLGSHIEDSQMNREYFMFPSEARKYNE